MSRSRPMTAATLTTSPAELCQDRGWAVGDVIRNPQGVRVRITAIGEVYLLGRCVCDRGPDGIEHQWDITGGGWQLASRGANSNPPERHRI